MKNGLITIIKNENKKNNSRKMDRSSTEIGFNQGLEVKKIFEDRNLNLFGSFNDFGGRERCLIFHKKKKV